MKKLHLNNISISHFKSISNVRKLALSDLNVIIGANGAGKSNFISIFQMLENMSRRNLQNFCMDNGDANSLFFFEGAKPQPINLQLDFKNGKTISTYNLELITNHKEAAFIAQEYISHDGAIIADTEAQNSDLTVAYSTESQLYRWGKDKKKYKYHYQIYNTISSWRAYHFHDTSIASFLRKPSHLSSDKNLLQSGDNLASYIFYLREKHPDIYEYLLSAIRCVAPFFLDFVFPYTWEQAREDNPRIHLTWKQTRSERLMQPWQFSDGTLRFIALVVALIQPDPPAIILVDEPEIGLHPAAISFISGLLHDASTRTQVIVTTQSPLLLENLDPHNVIVMSVQNNKSSCEKLDAKALKSWLEEYSFCPLSETVANISTPG